MVMRTRPPVAITQEPIVENDNFTPAQATPQPASRSQFYATPAQNHQRERVFHTVSKVPLKPAAIESPIHVTKRAHTVARPIPQRDAPQPPIMLRTPTRRRSLAGSTTPGQLSTAATPAQTPCRDISIGVLKGAVVFVDVHTTEGADASAVFIELLTSMGARCVKSWSWNPSATPSPTSSQSSDFSTSSKVGITHVVFKDGGKRTIEKVREAAGVVSCVGVGWVLDCERLSEWVAEAPYEIDVSLVPRGGRNRRKSMEPRALQNMNGELVEATPGLTPRSVSYASGISSKTPKSTKSRKSTTSFDRRKSRQWMLSPLSQCSSVEDDDPTSPGRMEETMILSPVPRTPDAEDVAEYAEHILDDYMGEPTPYAAKQAKLVQMTVPVKKFVEEHNGDSQSGGGLIYGQSESDTGVLMHRLLLARRKSLQWAPKVGSPLKSSAGTFSP